MSDDSTTLQSVPSHLHSPPPTQDDSSCEPESEADQSSDKKESTGSGNNLSDDPRPKGLGDAWIDIPMSQAIEFIPVLTAEDIKDIARYKGKVVVARINEQISTHKEKMSQSIATQKEKMSQSITQQRDKMTQHRDKMSQSLILQKVKVSQSLIIRKEKMSQQREKVSQSLIIRKEKISQQREKVSQSLIIRKEKMSQQREKVSQSLSQQRERMSQHREKMSQNFSIRKERVSLSFSNKRDKMTQHKEKVSITLYQRRLKVSQSLTSHRVRMSQSLSIKRGKMTLKSRQVREHMSVGAARVHQMREQVVTQMRTKFGTGLSPREFEEGVCVSPLGDIFTSPDNTPVCRKAGSMSQSCPNLYPLYPREEGLNEFILAKRDNFSICSFATTVSAQSSHSEQSDSPSCYSDSSYSDGEGHFIFDPPVPDIIASEVPPPLALTPTPTREVGTPLALTSSASSQEEVCPPLPVWAFPKHYNTLLTYPQLPSWYRDNECIMKYYRPPLNSLRKCLKSIGYWHSESGNIWSHLIGLIVFLVFVPHFAYNMFVRATTDSDFTWMDPAVISIFIFSALTCLLLSTSFHTLMCHSNKVYMLCLRVDYCGIALLIIGSYVPWFYYLFYCLRIIQITYISILTFLGVTAIITMIAPFFNRPKFRIFRALLFGCVGSFGVIPAIHAVIVQGFSAAMSLGGTSLMFSGGMFYIVGAGIYAIRLPERIFPGKCDLLLQSHTIFHICVLIAATFHYFSLLRIQEIRLLRGAYCSPDINI